MSYPIASSLLDGIVLAVVERESTYGYRITQDVQKVLDISESTLYPVLRRLMKDGCLTTYDQAYAGRNRRYYQITEHGRAALRQHRIDWQNYRSGIDTIFFGGGTNEQSRLHGSAAACAFGFAGGGTRERSALLRRIF